MTASPQRTNEVAFRVSRAFTLLELLIILTVMAVLAAIAIPSYRDYVLRSGRSEALTALKNLSRLEEEYYTDQHAYTGTISNLNYPTVTTNSLYQLQIATSTTTRYTLKATAIGSQLADTTCRTFTLTGMGERRAADSGGNDSARECWSR